MVIVRNKQNVPFGVFANTYDSAFEIDGDKFSNVAEYVATYKGIKYRLEYPYDLSLRSMWQDIVTNETAIAIREGIAAKSKADPKFDGTLVSTYPAPLLYVSNDPLLGVDRTTLVGKNLYGKWLSSYRNFIVSDNPSSFYNNYLLMRYLSIAITKEPLKIYLDMAREGAGVKYILENFLIPKYDSLMVNVPPITTVEQYRLKEDIKGSMTPEEIIIKVMKEKTRNVKVVNLRKFHSRLLELFVKDIIDRKSLKISSQKFFAKTKSNIREYLMGRVASAYEENTLRPALQSIVPEDYIPDAEEIEFSETVTPMGFGTKANALIDQETSILSMRNDSVVFTLEGKAFPSIHQYIVYHVGKLFDPEGSYRMIVNYEDGMFIDPGLSTRFLDENLGKFMENTNLARLRNGLAAKASSLPHLKDLLMMTDDVLGVMDFESVGTNMFYQEMKSQIKWEDVASEKGLSLDFILSDPFFSFCIKEMYDSFMSILERTTRKKDFATIKRVYEAFFSSIPGTEDGEMRVDFCISADLDAKSCKYLMSKFVWRITEAERAAKLFLDTDIVFGTKFMIAESRRGIYEGSFIPSGRTESSRIRLAIARLVAAVAVVNDDRTIGKDHLDAATEILTVPSQKSLFVQESRINRDKLATAAAASMAGGIIPDEDFVDNRGHESDEEKDDELDENRETEFDADREEEEEEFDDLMFAREDLEADNLSNKIIKSFDVDAPEQFKNYYTTCINRVANSPLKNIYRINLYN